MKPLLVQLGSPLIIVLAGFLMSARASQAGSVTYTYTGTTFLYLESCDTCLGGQPVTTTDRVFAYFVLDQPLAANFHGLVIPTNWAMSDGHSTLSPVNAILWPDGQPGKLGTVIVSTDQLGAITMWQMFAGTPADVSRDLSGCQAGTATCIGILTDFNATGDCCPPTIVDYSFYYPFGGAATSLTFTDGVPGSWACSPVSDCIPPPPIPEPSSLLLLGIGVAAVGALRRVRFNGRLPGGVGVYAREAQRQA